MWFNWWFRRPAKNTIEFLILIYATKPWERSYRHDIIATMWEQLVPVEWISFLMRMMTSSNGNIFRVTGCAGNSLLTGEFPSQRPVTRSFDVFFYLRPNKRRSLWRHCNGGRTELTNRSYEEQHVTSKQLKNNLVNQSNHMVTRIEATSIDQKYLHDLCYIVHL